MRPDEIKAILDALRDTQLHPIASLALATGARRGELLALRWLDIDLDRAILRIERSIEETRQGLRVKDEPKTSSGRRNVSLSSDAVAMLRAHWEMQVLRRLELGQGGRPELVFGTIEDRHLSPDNVSSQLNHALRTKNLPRITFHALRHTHVSMLIRGGLDILTIGRRVGHSSPSITLNVYSHLIEGADAAAAKAIEGVLK